MSTTAFKQAKAAIRLTLDTLSDADWVTLITYSGTANVSTELPSTLVPASADNLNLIDEVLNTLYVLLTLIIAFITSLIPSQAHSIAF
jgi:hypothetical protein